MVMLKTGSDQHYLPDGYGLDAPGQFSTARDMALLGKALIDVPEEYAIHKEKEFTFNKIRSSLTVTVCCGAAI